MSIDADVSDGRSSVNEVEGGEILSSVDVEGGTTTTLLVVSKIDIELKLLYILYYWYFTTSVFLYTDSCFHAQSYSIIKQQ